MRTRIPAAVAALVYARVLVAVVPLRHWRARLGLSARPGDRAEEAAMLARTVERAAALLPIATKCLPRAIALSVLLRHARIDHRVVLLVRPRGAAAAGDRLHAWVEHRGTVLIGDEPGPWIEIFAVGAA